MKTACGSHMPCICSCRATKELSNACVMSVSMRQAGPDLRSGRIKSTIALSLTNGKCGFNTTQFA